MDSLPTALLLENVAGVDHGFAHVDGAVVHIAPGTEVIGLRLEVVAFAVFSDAEVTDGLRGLVDDEDLDDLLGIRDLVDVSGTKPLSRHCYSKS